MYEFLFYLPLGIITGILSGLLGVGGGTVIVPVLVVTLPFAGVPLEHVTHVAIGTSLACITITVSMAAYQHHLNKSILWSLFIAIAPTLWIGSFTGAIAADAIPGSYINMILAAFLLFLAYNQIKKTNELTGPGTITKNFIHYAPFPVGMLSSMVGVSGGVVLTPLLIQRGLTTYNAAATAAILGAPLSLIGALVFVMTGSDAVGLPDSTIGYIYIPALIGITVTSIFTVKYGIKLSHKLDQKLINKLFCVFLLIVATRLIWTSLT